MPAYDVSAIVANLRAIRSQSTDAQVTEGRAWYPAMRRLILTIAAECADATGDYSVSDSLAIGVFAAFSQNATWKANVTLATRYLSGEGRGMRSILAECERMEDGESPDAVMSGLKRPDFWANLCGDMRPVTCDRWHIRASLATEKPPTLNADMRAAITEATQTVAAEFGESPAECQAVIWCTVRPSGNGQ